MQRLINKVFLQSNREPVTEEIGGYINDYSLTMGTTAYPMGPITEAFNPTTQSPETLLQADDTIFRQKRRHERTRKYCLELLEAVRGTEKEPFSSLDEVFTEMVDFRLDPRVSENNVTSQALDLLKRLPESPLPLDQMDQGQLPPNFDWHKLSVVSMLSTNTIRLALSIAADIFGGPELPLRRTVDRNPFIVGKHELRLKNHDWHDDQFGSYLHGTIELLEEVTRLQSTSGSAPEKKDWFIVKSFLWCSIQRGTQLVLWFVLDRQLRWGVLGLHQGLFGGLPRLCVATDRPIESMLDLIDAPLKSKYLCNWAYSLLRDGHSSIAFDMRLFHKRFNDIFGERRGRCLSGGESCSGRSPKSCQRFEGGNLKNVDQSMHSWPCVGGCKRLIWDKSSYLRASGGRAVSIEDTTDTYLRYKDTSSLTMAVSHVWSHGQGGRPDGEKAGFNICLHERYCRIAKHFGCDSYWMDTPCIPEDHELRKESIANINSVFASSWATLVCDKDLMSINVSLLLKNKNDISQSTVELQESIIAILLVSDWNGRSWTLLESLRGRQQIYLLFKGENVIELKSIVDSVCRYGHIDIAILFLQGYHMLPSVKLEVYLYPSGQLEESMNGGFVSKELAASMLSRRYASRKDDEVVIWSLLTSEKASYTVKEWWKSRAESFNMFLPTNYLVSSVPRVQGIDGLGWAPSKTGIHLLPSELERKIFYPNAGGSAEKVRIREDGIHGLWGIYTWRTDQVNKTKVDGRLKSLLDEKAQNLYKHFAFLHPLQNMTYSRSPDTGIAMAEPPKASRHPDCDGWLFITCGSHDGERWEWIGVVQCPAYYDMPKFSIEMIWLV